MTEFLEKAGILIVEDESGIAADLERRLTDLGYRVLGRAFSGEAALQLIDELQPDLVLMDILLGGEMNGIEATEAIRQQWDIPIVFVTSFESADRLERAKLTYPFGYLLKPFLDRDLRITTEMALYVAKVDRGRKEAENALFEETMRRRMLTQGSRDGIVVVDQRGCVFESNRKFAEMLGYSEEEVSDLHVWDWDDQWTREELRGMLQDVDESGDHFITRHRRKDGSVIVVEISTNAAVCCGKKLVFCVCRDITDRMRAEEALRKSEERFREMADLLPGAVIEMDTGYNVTYANHHGMKLFGYAKEDIASGLNALDIIHPDDREKVGKVIANREEKGPFSAEEFRVLKKNQESIWVLLNASPIYHDKQTAGYRAILIDNSERKMAEEQREELIVELKEAISEIKVLRGFLPICANCKKIRDDEGYWLQLEKYIQDHTDAQFTHGICPDCARELYPQYFSEADVAILSKPQAGRSDVKRRPNRDENS